MYYVATVIFCELVGFADFFFVNHDPYVFVSYIFVGPLLCYAPRFLYRRGYVNQTWLDYTERIILAIVVVNTPGTVYFYDHNSAFQYDRITHLVIAGISLPGLVALHLSLTGSVERTWKSLSRIVIFAFAGLFMWELWQFTNDTFLGTSLFHDDTQPIQRDATEDVFFGSIGLILAMRYTLNMKPKLQTFIR